MKTLNLVYPNKSDIAYSISNFPDGQKQVLLEYNDQACPIKIISRLNNFSNLELIICATKSMRSLGVKEVHLYTPYFLGSRSDRKFEEGSNNYLKDVICPIINSLNFESITVIDPHSDVLEASLNNFKKFSNTDLVKWVFMNHPQNTKQVNDFLLVSPDAGATKKIYKLAEEIGYKGKIITCSKDRDFEGKLTKSVVPLMPFNNDIIIIDDICDGGATFINISKNIKQRILESTGNIKSKIYLIVTHGIFSKGFKELDEHFDGMYCTNSYDDVNYEKVKQLNIF